MAAMRLREVKKWGDKLGLFPSPLWGGARGGGSRWLTQLAP